MLTPRVLKLVPKTTIASAIQITQLAAHWLSSLTVERADWL